MSCLAISECYLISPKVNDGHGSIIDEDGHLLASVGVESLALLLFELTFNLLLEVPWGGGGREVDSLEEHLIFVELGGVHQAD